MSDCGAIYIYLEPFISSRCDDGDDDDAPDDALDDADDARARMGALDDITATSRVNSHAESRDDVTGAHETRVKTWMRVTARADDLNSNDATGPRARVEAFASEGDGGGDDDGVDGARGVDVGQVCGDDCVVARADGGVARERRGERRARTRRGAS